MSLLTYIETHSAKHITDKLSCTLIHIDDSIYIVDTGIKIKPRSIYMFYAVPLAQWNAVLRHNIYIENHPRISSDPEYTHEKHTVTLTNSMDLACYISGISHSHSIVSVVECNPADLIQKPHCPNQFIISAKKSILPRLMLMIDNQAEPKPTLADYTGLVHLS